MYYTEISTLIIIVTSLVAFYLLYRARELSLGILISISLGSITLGFTFLPIFRAVTVLLKESIFMDRSFVFIISVLSVLIIFLIFILIISFIISLVMPNKLASIDCCVVIDNVIAKVKHGYTENNKLKKPVDTEQKIDTMGIEKEEVESDIILDNVAYGDVCACEETTKDATALQDHSKDSDITEQVNTDDSDMFQSEHVETITSDMSEEIEIYYSDNNNMGDQISETEVPEVETAEINAVETEVQIQEILEISISESETQIPAPEAKLEKILTEDVSDAKSLVLIALEKKGDNKKEEAIEYYMKALQRQPDVEMILWIVLDVCALYKQLGLNELAISILETMANQYGTVIKPEVKKEIMNCLV
jgi:hypothetical protein